MGANLVRPATLAAYLEDDSLAASSRAELLIGLASDLCRDYLGRDLDERTYTDVVLAPRYSWGLRRFVLYLEQWPVSELALTSDGDTIDPTLYDLDATRGRVASADRSFGDQRKLVATYTAGYTVETEDDPGNVPGALRSVVLRVVARGVYNPEGLLNERVGNSSTGFHQPGSTMTAAGLYLTPADERTLDRLRDANTP